MLENLFITVLNMSITASVAAVMIIFIRWIFGKRLPKIFNYALWAIVLVRLLIPFSLPSMFSIFNVVPVPETIMSQSQQYYGTNSTNYGSIPQEKTVSDVLNSNSFPAPTPEASVDPMQVIIFVISWIWLAGVVGLFSFSIFAYFRASLRLKEAVLYNHKDLIFQCSQMLKLNRNVQVYTSDRVHTPVVCGLIKTRIIFPLDLTKGCNELELKHIITHELVHIKRFDYILKPLSVLALCVHWFNPVIWIGFISSQKDMEMSCDEKVVSVFDNDIRSEYAASLIKLAAKQNVLLNGGLLAFGESSIKSRIKGIMSFRKSGFWLGTSAIVILVAISVMLLTNGQSKTVYRDDTNKNSIIPEQIIRFAMEAINRDIVTYESNPEVKIIDSRITRLELTQSFNSLADTPIDIYALEYRLLPNNLSKVVLAGGMQIDEDGWLKETCSMGSPLLVVERKTNSLKLIGNLWTGGVEEDGGLESSVKAILKRNDELGTTSGLGDYLIYKDDRLKFSVNFPKAWGYKKNTDTSIDGGVDIYIDRVSDNYINVFGQLGHISIPYEGFKVEKFKFGNAMVGDMLVRDVDGYKEFYIIFSDEYCKGAFLGAHVKVNIASYNKNDVEIMKVLQSIISVGADNDNSSDSIIAINSLDKEKINALIKKSIDIQYEGTIKHYEDLLTGTQSSIKYSKDNKDYSIDGRVNIKLKNNKEETLYITKEDIKTSENSNCPIRIKLKINSSEVEFESLWNDGVHVSVADFDETDNDMDIYITTAGTDIGSTTYMYKYDGKKIYQYDSFNHLAGRFCYDGKDKIYYWSYEYGEDEKREINHFYDYKTKQTGKITDASLMKKLNEKSL